MEDFHDESVYIPYIIGGFLSIFGSLSIITTYIVYASLRKRILYRMVFFMSVCDFGFTLKFLIPALVYASNDDVNLDNDSWSCVLQCISGQFFGLATIMWYCMICVNATLAMRSHVPILIDTVKKREKFFHFFVWMTSITTTISIIFSHEYGYDIDGTCWIKGNNNMLRFFFFYIPLLLCMTVALVFLYRVIINRNTLFSGSQSNTATFYRMIALALIFVVIWIPPLITRVIQFTETKIPEALLICHRLSISIQGFANFLIWASTPSFRQICTRIRHHSMSEQYQAAMVEVTSTSREETEYDIYTDDREEDDRAFLSQKLFSDSN